MAHAKYFGPSSLSRRIRCTGSAKLETQFPNSSSSAADLGSAVHLLAETSYIQGFSTNTYVGRTFDGYPDYPVTTEMATDAQCYLDKIRSFECTDADVEQEISFAEFVLSHAGAAASMMGEDAQALVASEEFRKIIEEDCFGTSDFIGVDSTEGELIVWDYKNGTTPVYAVGNPQLRAYGIGAYLKVNWLYDDLDNIRLGITQPNATVRDLDHPIHDSEVIAIDELLAWGATVMVPAIIRSLLPNPAFRPSESACLFCNARGACQARKDWIMEEAAEDFKDITVQEMPAQLPMAETMTPDQIAQAMKWEDRLGKWFDDIRAEAERLAIDEAVQFPGQKVIRGTTHIKWVDEEAAERALQRLKVSVTDRRKPPSLKTPNQIAALLEGGKGHPFFERHTVRPEGALKLVPESAKGKPVDVKPKLEQAADDFAEFDSIL